MDWIIEWYVDDLVTLDNNQDWQLTNAIEQEILWHRTTQLPLYVESLDQLIYSIEHGLKIEELREFFQISENAWTTLTLHATPTVTRLFQSLNDAQIDELMKNLEAQNRELEEDYANKPNKELVEQRSERMTERLESWTGNLNKSQQRLIDDWSRQVQPLSKQWIATRRAWQANLGQILRNYRDKPVFAKLIHDLFYNYRKFWPQWYHDAYYQNIHLTLQMITELIQQLTPAQKQHLLKAVKRLRNNFQELSEDT
ncbi:MAG: DUF6279 family lipoprotein [Gammaproteobacteria bacterium]